MKNDLAEGLTREVLGEVNGWRLAEPGILGPLPGPAGLGAVPCVWAASAARRRVIT